MSTRGRTQRESSRPFLWTLSCWVIFRCHGYDQTLGSRSQIAKSSNPSTHQTRSRCSHLNNTSDP
jgi:hypothetical protein